MEFVAPPTGLEVAKVFGRENDPDFVALCGQHASLITRMVGGYCRGQGFDDGGWVREDLRQVIVLAAARLAVNPSQQEVESADGYMARGGFHGFSLPELAILHSYRRRTA